MNKATALEKATEIIALFEKFGNHDYIGENVSQIEHMTQCALLAEHEGYDEEVILGALFILAPNFSRPLRGTYEKVRTREG